MFRNGDAIGPPPNEGKFSRPFADFDPGPAQLEAGSAVREFIVGRVRRCTSAGILQGNETDIAHVLLALAQGLAAREIAGWLGTSQASVQRRWDLAIGAVLDGLGAAPGRYRDSGQDKGVADQPATGEAGQRGTADDGSRY